MRKGFIFDQNMCVGCHACVVACQIENGGISTKPWRQISTFNEFQFTNIPLFHFSLACNHCEEAPCVTGCPALAYTKDNILDIVKHHENRCIGCEYCTWVCPYDAPKYSEIKGIIEKCTLCEERIKDHKKPACANLCPTGALDYGDMESFRDYSGIPGFPENNIQPSVKIIPLRKKHALPEMDQPSGCYNEKLHKRAAKNSDKKINLKKEWVLVAFTIVCSLLAGLFYALFFNGVKVNPWLFLGAGVVAGLMTFLHLGKKNRAWRAVLNISQSWLSREIAAFGGFILLSGLFLFVIQSVFVGVLTVMCGFFLLYAIDKVYYMAVPTTPFGIHSASVLLTGIFFASLLSGNEYVYFATGFLKLVLYIYRKGYFIKKGKNVRLGLTGLRLILGFAVPLALFFMRGSDTFLWVFISIFLAEMIDRTEFYLELKIMSPSLKIQQDLAKISD